MGWAVGYLGLGLGLHIFVHSFYSYIPGLSFWAKLRGFMVTLFFWPLVLVVLIADALGGS